MMRLVLDVMGRWGGMCEKREELWGRESWMGDTRVYTYRWVCAETLLINTTLFRYRGPASPTIQVIAIRS